MPAISNITSEQAAAELSRPWPNAPRPDQYGQVTDLVRSLDGIAPRADQVAMICLAGSHGYGLAHEKSDLDLRGFFVMPGREYLAAKSDPEVEPRPSQLRSEAADIAFVELGRFVADAAAAKPNMFEILWAPVIYASAEAQLLREHRDLFLSLRIRDTYAGFAMSQKRRALDRVAGTSDPGRRAKHIRHMFRLYSQGLQLLEKGTMDYRLDDSQIAYIRSVEYMDDEALEAAFTDLDTRFKAAQSDLPEKPDHAAINDLVFEIRMRQLRRDDPAMFS